MNIDNCNCRNHSTCPLDRNCLATSAVYKCKVTTPSAHISYIGLTQNSFKSRYSQHLHSFRNHARRNSTTISAFLWELNERVVGYHLKWSILCSAKPYTGNGNPVTCILRRLGSYCLTGTSYKHKI